MISIASRDRALSAFGVAAFHVLLGYALLAGFGAGAVRLAEKRLQVFDIALVPLPASKAPVPSREAPDPEGVAAPPALKAEASAVVAPIPEVQLPPPPPVAAAPYPGEGAMPSAGTSLQPGPGTGAGGTGSGMGGGGSGGGTGGGGAAIKARQIAGRIAHADYPRAASRAGAEGEVLVRFTVAPTGRVGPCTVVRSSGNADLDAITCRLIQKRYRFEPARDAAGRPISEEKAWVQRWWLEKE